MAKVAAPEKTVGAYNIRFEGIVLRLAHLFG
jgi:hypothetical protein